MPNYIFQHFDTFDMQYSQDAQLSTYNFIPSSPIYSPSAYKVDFQLKTPIKFVDKIYLKSFESPIAFPNIRSTSLLNYVNVNCDGVVKKVIIPDGTFNKIDDLVNTLNIYSLALFPDDDIVFSISEDYNIGNVKITSTIHPSISVNRTNLSYMLGFRPVIDSTYTDNVVAAYKYNLNIDSYVNMYISNLHTTNTPNVNGKLCTYKIGLNATSDTVFYSSDNVAFSQYLTIGDPYKVIDRISVQFFDRFGYSIPAWGSDATFSLLFQTL